MKSYLLSVVATCGLIFSSAAMSQEISGPITMLHGFAPGGSADTVSRLVADPLSERLGVTVVVESRPGAGGTLASAAIAAADPGGKTIGLVTGGHAVAAGLYNSLPYDTVGDFTWLSTIVEYDFMLAVLDESPHQTLQDLLEEARENPGDVSYGSAGVGTTHHLAGLLLGDMAQVELEHVPYRGEAAAITGLLGGEIPIIIASPVTLEPQIKAGKMRALAVTSSNRLEIMPDIPTVAEAGVEGYEVLTWSGIVGPADMPADIQDRIRAEIQAVLADPAVGGPIAAAVGGTVVSSSGQEFHDRVAADVKRWTEVIEAAGLEKQ